MQHSRVSLKRQVNGVCVRACVRARACGGWVGGAYFDSRLKSFPVQALVSAVLKLRVLIP